MARSGWRGHPGDGYSCAMPTGVGENKPVAPSLMRGAAFRPITNPPAMATLTLTFNPEGNAGKRGFINATLDDIAMTIASVQHTLGPFGTVVGRRLQPIAGLEIEMEGVVIAISIVTFFASGQRNFRNEIAEILFNPRTQHACKGQIADADRD